MKCCANIYFNRQYLIKTVALKYANIQHSSHISCRKHHPKESTDNPTKNEIKFLHVKKETLNNKLYRIQLKAAQEWGNTWYNTLASIKEELEKKYKIIEMKLQIPVRTQIKQPENTRSFTLALSTKLT
jgi:hypothetical protein